MKKDWLFFGCYKHPGHYLFRRHMVSVSTLPERSLTGFDGLLAPMQYSDAYTNKADRYVATITRLPGWGYTALSFWDNTVDTRGGSNCIFFAPSLTITFDEMLKGIEVNFPEVWVRFPKIILFQPLEEY